MREMICAPVAVAALATAIALSGCSGPGVPAERAQGAGVRAIAQDHLSATLLAKSWLSILHERLPEPGEDDDAQGPAWETEFLPDGSMRMWGTYSHGGAFEHVVHPDGSGTGMHTTPDGLTHHSTWTAPEWEGMTGRQQVQETFWDGMVLEYDFAMDFDVPTSLQMYEGTATLPDGRAMQFRFERLQPEADDWGMAGVGARGRGEGYDHLQLALPDGSRLEVRIPLVTVEQATYWPVFARGAEGQFISASGARQEFTVRGDGERWERWGLVAPDGTQGAFTLGPEFEGGGLLTLGDRPVGALRWSASAEGSVDVLDAGLSAVTPSAAARDFQIDRWVLSIAGLGPAPIY